EGTDPGAEEGSEGSGETEGSSPYPALPETLSLRGCEDLGVGPLCSVTQDGASVSANCGGVVYTGELAESGNITWTTESTVNGNGATVETSCEGRFLLGQLQLTCTQTTSATDETEASEATCSARSKRTVLPGVACMELPSEIEDFVLCAEGEDNGSVTLSADECRVIQDGCDFQIQCADDLVLSGTVGASTLGFRYVLPALAD